MKILRILVGLIVLGVILTAAFFLFIYLATFVAVFLGYWWWKTRALRKHLHSALQQQATRQQFAQDAENVMEGEVVGETGQRITLPEAKVIYHKSANDKSY